MLIKLPLLVGLCLGSAWAQAEVSATLPAPSHADSLTLEKALESVFKDHPALAAGRSAVSARAAAAEQAGRGPNPELGVEIEDVGGTGGYRGVDAAQTTFQVSQTLEWAGKRDRRRQVAAVERKLAETELRGKRLELRTRTRVLFMETLAAQRRLVLADEAALLAQRLLEAVSRRVQEGAASSADEILSRLAVSEARLELRQDSLRLAAARRKMALLLDGEGLALPALRGDLDSLPPIPEESWNPTRARNPEVALKAEGVLLAQARLEQQQGLVDADVTVSAGLRHAAGPGDVAWVGGLSMPLPIRNRNQGGREEARHELARAKAEEKSFLLELESDAAEIRQAMALARDEARTLQAGLIPDGEKAAQVLEEGYRRGRFGLLEVLGAKGVLFRHRMRYLDAFLRYQQGFAEWERLTGAGDAPEGK